MRIGQRWEGGEAKVGVRKRYQLHRRDVTGALRQWDGAAWNTSLAGGVGDGACRHLESRGRVCPGKWDAGHWIEAAKGHLGRVRAEGNHRGLSAIMHGSR